MDHARNYLEANVETIKAALRNKTRKHDFQMGLTYKFEKITENSIPIRKEDAELMKCATLLVTLCPIQARTST